MSNGRAPIPLKVLCIQYNALSGPLILADLPRNLIHVDISNNAFTGEINLDDLPPQLTTFKARKNNLCGEISMLNIPPSIDCLDLKFNQFRQDVLVVRDAASWRYQRMVVDRDKIGKIVDADGKEISAAFPEFRMPKVEPL